GHEDSHANVYAQYYARVFQGYMIFYNQCICIDCYETWLKYMGWLKIYEGNRMSIQQAKIDCNLGNAAACDDMKARQSNQANDDAEMLRQIARLITVCNGAGCVRR